MIVSVLEWTGASGVYIGAGSVFARSQSIKCWKLAKRRFTQTRTQEQGFREYIAVRVLLWPVYLPSWLILRAVEKPVAQAKEELASTKAALAEWTDTEKFAIDDVSESIAKLEKARLAKRVLELEA